MFVWNEYDFVECLGVLPKVEEFGLAYSYQVEKDQLRLELTVFDYDGDVYFDLYREGIEHSIFHMQMTKCQGAKYVKNRGGAEYLEFAPANSFGNRFDCGISYLIRSAVDRLSAHQD